MISRKVQKVRDSYLVTIPRHLCDVIGIEKGTVIGIEYEHNRIVMTPILEDDQDTTRVGVALYPEAHADG